MWVDVDTAVTVPVNVLALTDATDFVTRETAVAYNAAGMDLVWNFQTAAGVTSQTAVTPTTAGDYDWSHSGDGMYKIEIPASGGASINNDTEGTGWFTGICTGVLHWRGPFIGFRAAGLNDVLMDSAYSTTRGLAGTALPNAAAEAAGGLYTRGTGAGQINQANNGQIDANAARTGGTTNTGRDIGASVLLSSGTGTGQISLSSGAVLLQATQTGVTIPTVTTVGSVSGSVGSVTGAVGSVTGAVGSVTGNVTGSIGSLAAQAKADVNAEADTAITDAALATAANLAIVAGYLDTEIAAIKAKTDTLPASPAAVGSAMTLTSGERDSVAAALLDLSNGIETSLTPRQALRLILAASAGKLSGAATTTITIRNVGDSKNRIVATVDSDGNRSAVTTDGT
jgi:hypothetical protein